MAMKKTDLEKNKALKLTHALKQSSSARFGKGAEEATKLDRRAQRKLDQEQGLVPFACKLNADLVEQLKARAATHPEGMTGLLSELLVNEPRNATRDPRPRRTLPLTPPRRRTRSRACVRAHCHRDPSPGTGTKRCVIDGAGASARRWVPPPHHQASPETAEAFFQFARRPSGPANRTENTTGRASTLPVSRPRRSRRRTRDRKHPRIEILFRKLVASMRRGHTTYPERLVSPEKAFPPIETGDYLMNASRVILARRSIRRQRQRPCDDPDHDAPAAQQQTSDHANQASAEAAGH